MISQRDERKIVKRFHPILKNQIYYENKEHISCLLLLFI